MSEGKENETGLQRMKHLWNQFCWLKEINCMICWRVIADVRCFEGW